MNLIYDKITDDAFDCNKDNYTHIDVFCMQILN